MELADRLRALVGATTLREVRGGHQARLFEAAGGPLGHVAVKAVDAALVDRAEHVARVAVVGRLAAVEERVCAPRPIGDGLVNEVPADDGAALVTVYDWAEGRAPVPADAHVVGRTLALLHGSMRAVDPGALPPVAALRVAPADPALGDQLLHGDYGAGNIRLAPTSVRVFDLDDCGRGPALFDLANAVYMARFAGAHDPAAAGTDGIVTRDLLAGYAEGTGTPVDVDLVEDLVRLRLRALLEWLDDLDGAPIGIRTADPTWHDVLRRYAEERLA